MQPHHALVCAIALCVAGTHSANCDTSTTMPQADAAFEIRGVAENDDQNADVDIFPDPSPPSTNLRVLKVVLMNSTSLKDVKLSKASPDGKHQSIELTFTPAGALKLEKISTDFLNKRIAFFIDGKICCVPMVMAKMSAGQAVIWMGSNDTAETTKTLVDRLKNAIEKSPAQPASTQP